MMMISVLPALPRLYNYIIYNERILTDSYYDVQLLVNQCIYNIGLYSK